MKNILIFKLFTIISCSGFCQNATLFNDLPTDNEFVTKSLSIFKLFQTGDTDSISRLQIIDNDSRKLIKSASQCIINGEVRDTQYVEQYIPREKSSIHILVKCPAQMQETNFRIEIVSDGIEGVLKNLLLTIKPESYEAINDFIKNTPLPTKN